MKSLGTVLILAFSFALPAMGGDGKQVILRWHGHSFFDLESSQGTRVVFDPHAIENYGPIHLKADVVLMSHFHDDHHQLAVVENAARAKLIDGLVKTGARKIDWNRVDEKFRDVHIRTVGVYHDESQGMERGKNAVFIVEMDGLKFVHLGDIGHLLTPAQIKEIGPVDVLMIPVGGVYTINGEEAKKVVKQLRPRLFVLPMHYGTKAFDEVLPLDEFLEDEKNVKRGTTNKLIIDTGARPAEPTIVILDWK